MAVDDVTIVPLPSDAALQTFAVRFPPPARRRVITTVTSRADTVCSWIHDTYRIYSTFHYRGRLVVGLGVQCRARSGRDPPDPTVSTIQLSVGSRCLVFHLVHADSVPSLLRSFLDDPNVCFTGVGIAHGCRLLKIPHGLTVARPEEIRKLAATVMRRKNCSMKNMVKKVMGRSWGAAVVSAKKRRVGRSDWDAPNLSHEQIIYACVDAQLSYRLGLKLIWGRIEFVGGKDKNTSTAPTTLNLNLNQPSFQSTKRKRLDNDTDNPSKKGKRVLLEPKQVTDKKEIELNISIVLVGEPLSGKTTLIAEFYRRHQLGIYDTGGEREYRCVIHHMQLNEKFCSVMLQETNSVSHPLERRGRYDREGGYVVVNLSDGEVEARSATTRWLNYLQAYGLTTTEIAGTRWSSTHAEGSALHALREIGYDDVHQQTHGGADLITILAKRLAE